MRAVVKLPKGSSAVVLSRDGIRVNGSDAPMSKIELFNALSVAARADALDIVRQYMEFAGPDDDLSAEEVLDLLRAVSSSDEVEALELVWPKIKKPISTDFALRLLDEVSMAEEFLVLQRAADDLETPLEPMDLARFVDAVGMSEELDAFKLLAPKVAKDRRAELLDVVERELSRADRTEATRFLLRLE